MIDRMTPATGVLVGVDDRRATLRAVAWAAREAARRHVPLDLVQVLPGEGEPVLRPAAGRARALLDRARRVAMNIAEPPPSVRMSVSGGRPGPALVHLAVAAQLLVVGSRPVDGPFDLTVGHNLAQAVGHAPCPTVVVPPGWTADRDAGSVLVGLDRTTTSVGAAAFAADVARRWGRRAQVVTVRGRAGGSVGDDQVRRHLTATVAGLAERFPGLAVEETVGQGEPGPTLVRLAGQHAALIALGTHGYGSVTGPLLASTSQTVIRWARCPVAVLSPEAARVWARDQAPSLVHESV